MSRQNDIFAAGAQRLQMTESIELTIQSMQAYGADHEHWAVAWSGGKDSTTTLTLLIWLIDTGRIKAPKTLTVFYADTRQELPPLAIAAHQIMDECGTAESTSRWYAHRSTSASWSTSWAAACPHRTTTRCAGVPARSRSTRCRPPWSSAWPRSTGTC